jgi:2-hydroxycyclohexanecarboxyl-CoA dehydrogenase
MDLGLTGKVAVVTGAGSQIGFGNGICVTLAEEGCDVVAADKDLAGAKLTAASVEKLGRRALAVECDVTKKADVDKMVADTLTKFGKIDILVNNAGGTLGRRPFLEQDDSVWEWELALNLKGCMLCSQAVLPHMTARKYGKIVNIASETAKSVSPFMGVSMYSIAKMGVYKFSRDLAVVAIQDGIYVNCVSPGASLYTDFMTRDIPDMKAAEAEFRRHTPDGEMTKPRDIAVATAFFASDLTGHIVGQVLSVSGGGTFQ